jgi:CheY-like chemotaxis protein
MTGKAKILVVEDQTSVAMMMVFLLTRAGCDVAAAWNAEKALQLAQAGVFDLITLDVSLPGMNGFELCRRLKQNPRLRETPVVFVSGQLGEEEVQRALKLGAVDCIEKPFEPTDFIFRIISHAKPNRSFDTVPATEGAVA